MKKGTILSKFTCWSVLQDARDTLNYNSNINNDPGVWIFFFLELLNILKTATGNQVRDKSHYPSTNSSWNTSKEVVHVLLTCWSHMAPFLHSMTPWKMMQIGQREIGHFFSDFWWRLYASLRLFFVFVSCLPECHLHTHFWN